MTTSEVLAGRSAVVTGAASGLARAIAISYAAAGAEVMLVDIDEHGLDGTVRTIVDAGGDGRGHVADVSDPAAVEALFGAVDDTGRGIDILVNAVFSHEHGAPEEITYERWRRTIAASLDSYFLCSQAAGRRMIAQARGGSIVNLSSIAGSSAMGRGNLAYSVAKGGIHMLTKELAVEWGRHGVRVNAIQPCQTRTPALERWLGDPDVDDQRLVAHLVGGIPLGRFAEMDDIVGPALFLASDASAMVTGVCLPVDGGNLAMNAAGGDPRP